MPTLGLDLGGTKLLAGVVERDGTVLASERERIAGLPLGALIDLIVDVITRLGPDLEVGVGIPALIDQRSGIAVRCVHLPFDGVNVGEVLAGRLGRPVKVDNDATCAVLAEWTLGAARGHSHVALLTLGTGIGGGLVLDGRVYRGAVGAAGELGHVPVDLDGPACFGGCPSRGCLEALCSGSALARDGSALLGRPVTGEQVTELARSGDIAATRLIETLGDRLGAGLAGIAMSLNPEVIVVGGGVMAAGELVLGPARAELRRRALAPSRDVEVVAAALGQEAGMIGAALL
jgi:glucokinase